MGVASVDFHRHIHTQPVAPARFLHRSGQCACLVVVETLQAPSSLIGTSPSAPGLGQAHKSAKTCHAGDAALELTAHTLSEIKRDETIHRIPLRRHGAALGVSDLFGDHFELAALFVGLTIIDRVSARG